LDEVDPVERLLQDIRFGTRSLVKSPRFTIAATVALAIGIGANTAMFSVIHSVLMKSWPLPQPGRLAFVSERQADGNFNLFSTRDYLDWKQRDGLLAHMSGHVSWAFNLSSAGAPPERVSGGEVSSDFFPVLGAQPLLGRFFSASEDLPGSGNFVLLGFALWKDRYAADPQIAGKAIQLDGVPYTVVGVMPAGFNGFDGKELLWTPLQLRGDTGVGASRNVHWLNGCIRLPDGVSLKQVQGELDAVAARLHRDDPSGDAGFGVYLQSINDALSGGVRPALLMLMGSVGFVLLIACANVANLLLARGAARRREMAVRTALGASPARVVRQLLTESILLGAAGGTAGIAIAFVLLRGVLALHPPQVPHIEETGIDGTVLVFTLAVSGLVGILFGLAPAIAAARLDVNQNLRQQVSSTSRGSGRQRSILVIVETALACMLLSATGLALKSLWSLRTVDLGFDSKNVLTFRIAAPKERTGAAIAEFYREVVERIGAIPGVQSAAVARNFPLSGIDPSMPILTEGKTPAPVQGEIVTRYRAVGEDYFRTLKIPLRQGRSFGAGDTANSPAVAMVSESLARKYWPGESAVGKRIKPGFAGSAWCAVVGVVADVRHWGADVAIEPTAYYPYTQVPESLRPLVEANLGIAIRSTMAQSDLVHAISGAVGRVDRAVPVYDVKTLRAMLEDAGSLRNFDFSLLGLFSLIALMLAATGVYAVMAYSVSQRTREIGIRMAMGAHARDVLRAVLWESARLAIAGSLAGVVGAFFLRKVMAGFVYGLSTNDPGILAAVPCLMLLVVLLACWMPARKAARIDPIVALHYE
jgi:putative ABC transport system permease protein